MSNNIRTLDAATQTHLQSWVGKTETLSDDITAAPVRGCSAALDLDEALPVPGTVLAPLWHRLYFLPQHRQSEMGADGHAKRGGFLPPVPLPRRMWAGGRLQWRPENPLRVGDVVQRNSRIASVTHKPVTRCRRPCRPKKAQPGSARSSQTPCCCSATRRSPSTAIASTMTANM